MMKVWVPHIVLVVIAAVMVAVASSKHLSSEEAVAVALDPNASPEARVWASHVAANRATHVDPEIGVGVVTAFQASGIPLLAEASLLVHMCRHAVREPGAEPDSPPPLQNAYAYAGLANTPWNGHRIRSVILQRRKVGGTRVGGIKRIQYREAEWFIDSLLGEPLPDGNEIVRYLKDRTTGPGVPRRGRVNRGG